MTTREKMINWRIENDIPLRTISHWTGLSETILSMVEAGEVTHPKIVEKIRRAYHLTEKEAEELLPKNYRKSDPEYDPERYVSPIKKGDY